MLSGFQWKSDVIVLLSKELTLLVLISFFLASPIAYYFVNDWLSGFEYKISLGVGVFLIAGSATLMIAISTVGIKSLLAALSNPAEILRND